jgi:hypothetical protein
MSETAGSKYCRTVLMEQTFFVHVPEALCRTTRCGDSENAHNTISTDPPPRYRDSLIIFHSAFHKEHILIHILQYI